MEILGFANASCFCCPVSHPLCRISFKLSGQPLGVRLSSRASCKPRAATTGARDFCEHVVYPFCVMSGECEEELTILPKLLLQICMASPKGFLACWQPWQKRQTSEALFDLQRRRRRRQRCYCIHNQRQRPEIISFSLPFGGAGGGGVMLKIIRRD